MRQPDKFLVYSAEKGDSDAQYELGRFFANGIGNSADIARALIWWEKSALSGNDKSMFQIGLSYDEGRLVKRDVDLAIQWYERAAKAGQEGALFNAGCISWEEGNTAQAFKRWRRLAKLGLCSAQMNIAICYARGYVMCRDLEEARLWFLKSTSNGFCEALYNAGVFYAVESPRLPGAAVDYWLKASSCGHYLAKYHLANYYREGIGLEVDHARAAGLFSEALKGEITKADSKPRYTLYLDRMSPPPHHIERSWQKRAAELGHPEALYREGLVRESAESGYVDAQYELGVCYVVGKGVPKDLSLAVRWLEKAAKADHAKAQYELARCYSNSKYVHKDAVKAWIWFRSSLECGNCDALLDLARCYEHGRGVDRDEVEAYALYALAGYDYKLAFLKKRKFAWKSLKEGERRIKSLTREIENERTRRKMLT
jgi:TPR repeat protein